MTASAALAEGRPDARLRAEGRGLRTHVVQLAGCEARWSATLVAAIQEANANPTLITQVTMSSNQTVYAVWGYDDDDDGVADFIQDKFSLTYSVTPGSGGPSNKANILSGSVEQLSMTPVPTRANDGDRAVVFSGWSATSVAAIQEANANPTLITEVTMSSNQTVYAVWGYDDDGNGVADFLQDKFSLTYSVTPGIGGPSNKTNILSGTVEQLSMTPVPTRANDGDRPWYSAAGARRR
jgi:2',3'-cyclic-nucleotide 2'-phosphodiesterase (5'-nucleotidase family)